MSMGKESHVLDLNIVLDQDVDLVLFIASSSSTVIMENHTAFSLKLMPCQLLRKTYAYILRLYEMRIQPNAVLYVHLLLAWLRVAVVW